MTHLNDLYMYGLEVITYKDGEVYSVDVRENDTDGDIIAGYTDLTSEDDAEFVARAFIDGYRLGKAQK